MGDKDIERLKKEYERRDQENVDIITYSHLSPSYNFYITQLNKSLNHLFHQEESSTVKNRKILEIGCGSGGVLQNFLKFGVHEDSMFGVDLLFRRLLTAKSVLQQAKFINSDAQYLPFPGDLFDCVLQFTAFSSILNMNIKMNMASEMLRVTKEDGAIIWYDFWWNPTNPQTEGIKPAEIRKLFPECNFIFRKITLAPPIARKVVPLSWPFALLLESLKIFNSHYLVLIKKRVD